MLVRRSFQMLSRSHIQSTLLSRHSTSFQCPSSNLLKALAKFFYLLFIEMHISHCISSLPFVCSCWGLPQIFAGEIFQIFVRFVHPTTHPHTAIQVVAQFCDNFDPNFGWKKRGGRSNFHHTTQEGLALMIMPGSWVTYTGWAGRDGGCLVHLRQFQKESVAHLKGKNALLDL